MSIFERSLILTIYGSVHFNARELSASSKLLYRLHGKK